MKRSSLYRVLFGVSIVSVAAAGCTTPVDLTAVEKYADATADASSSFADIAADYAASCRRRHDALDLLPANLGSRTLRHATIPLAPGAGSADATPAASASAPPCAAEDGISDEWRRHDDIVLNYVHELGAIAGVDAVPAFDPSPLESPLVSANTITAAQFDAFSQLSTAIATTVIRNDQRAEIAKLTTAADKPLHEAVDALELVDAAYAQQLSSEYGTTEGAYEALIGRELEVRSKAEPADQFLLSGQIAQQRETERIALLAINDRRKATIRYAEVLDAIAATHRRLVEASSRNASMADYLAIFQQTVVPLYGDVQALKAAVK